MTHTPGPWVVQRSFSSRGFRVDTTDPNGYPITIVPRNYRTEEEVAANAQLIAAAPLMLMSLQQVHEFLIEAHKISPHSGFDLAASGVEVAINSATKS